MTKLSEQLADLSVQAKSAEDALTAAEKEAHDKSLLARSRLALPRQPRSKRLIRKSIPLVTLPLNTGVPLRRKSLPT